MTLFKKTITLVITLQIFLTSSSEIVLNVAEAPQAYTKESSMEYKPAATFKEYFEDFAAFFGSSVYFDPISVIPYISNILIKYDFDSFISRENSVENVYLPFIHKTQTIGTSYASIESMNRYYSAVFGYDFDYNTLPFIYRDHMSDGTLTPEFYVSDSEKADVKYKIEYIRSYSEKYIAQVLFYNSDGITPVCKVSYTFNKAGNLYTLISAQTKKIYRYANAEYFLNQKNIGTSVLLNNYTITGSKTNDIYTVNITDKSKDITYTSEYSAQKINDNAILSPNGEKLALIEVVSCEPQKSKLIIIELSDGSRTELTKDGIIAFKSIENYGWLESDTSLMLRTDIFPTNDINDWRTLSVQIGDNMIIDETCDPYEGELITLCEVQQENITLSAFRSSRNNGVYQYFLLCTENYSVVFDGISTAVSDSWQPKITVSDFNGDGEDEICIIFTTETGTSIHTEQVRLFDRKTLKEIPVQSAEDIISENVHFTSDANNFYVEFNGNKHTLPKKDGNMTFDSVRCDLYYNYDVENSILTAHIPLQTGVLSYSGELMVTYVVSKAGAECSSIKIEP